MKLLDLFCGAGGASTGYHRAGFEVTGVDVKPQKRYPFRFVQTDALEYAAEHGHEYDVIAASPPCQAYGITSNLPQSKPDHPKLIAPTRTILEQIGRPYVIENVVGAPLYTQIILCGLMFGLKLFRHRVFESNILLMQPPHPPHGDNRIGENGFCCVVGTGDAGRNVRINAYHRRKSTWEIAMDINWMSKVELTQAVPPPYTEFIGRQLARVVENRKVVPHP